jgi:hypothetical protein
MSYNIIISGYGSYASDSLPVSPGQILAAGTRRVTSTPISYSSQTWVPGSNNAYTAGRNCDHFDRGYGGSSRRGGKP